MSTVRHRAEEYLAMRRSLGYKLQPQGRLLLGFVDYLQHTGADTITVEAAVAWAKQPAGRTRSGGSAGFRWCAASPGI